MLRILSKHTTNSFLLHSGPNRGHYIAIVKSHDFWLLFDDDIVEVRTLLIIDIASQLLKYFVSTSFFIILETTNIFGNEKTSTHSNTTLKRHLLPAVPKVPSLHTGSFWKSVKSDGLVREDYFSLF